MKITHRPTHGASVSHPYLRQVVKAFGFGGQKGGNENRAEFRAEKRSQHTSLHVPRAVTKARLIHGSIHSSDHSPLTSSALPIPSVGQHLDSQGSLCLEDCTLLLGRYEGSPSLQDELRIGTGMMAALRRSIVEG